MLQFLGSQRVRYNSGTELNWTELIRSEHIEIRGKWYKFKGSEMKTWWYKDCGNIKIQFKNLKKERDLAVESFADTAD